MTARLTAKQEQFAHEYLVDFNSSAAARRAKYSEASAAIIGWENLRKPKIQARIAELAKKHAERVDLEIEWVLKRAMAIANTQMKDVAEWGDDGVRVKARDEIAKEAQRAIKKLKSEAKILKAAEDGTPLITATKTEIEMWDPRPHLELLARYLKMFFPDHETPDDLEQYRGVALMQKLPSAQVSALRWRRGLCRVRPHDKAEPKRTQDTLRTRVPRCKLCR